MNSNAEPRRDGDEHTYGGGVQQGLDPPERVYLLTCLVTWRLDHDRCIHWLVCHRLLCRPRLLVLPEKQCSGTQVYQRDGGAESVRSTTIPCAYTKCACVLRPQRLPAWT